MITLMIILFCFILLAMIVTVAMGIIAISPILLVIFALPLLDFVVYKLWKSIKKDD